MMEYAPNGWSSQGGTTRGCSGPNANADITCVWDAQATAPTSGFAYNIGAGYGNTNIIRTYVSGGTASNSTGASDTARQYTGSSKRSMTYYLQDWYLPNFAEMTQLCKWANGNALSAFMCTGGTLKPGFSAGNYWTSDGPTSATGQAIALNMTNGARVAADRSTANYIRPIRYFQGVIDPSSIPTTTLAPTTTTTTKTTLPPTTTTTTTTTTLPPTTTTTTTKTTLPPTTTTLPCASGGNCAVGNVGPGGGKIFYVSSARFTCGTSLQSTCLYLEAAPDTWYDNIEDPLIIWCSNSTNFVPPLVGPPSSPATIQTSTVIGAGYSNTQKMLLGCTSGAANTVAAYRGGGLSDWFLPSKDELKALHSVRATAGLGVFRGVYAYWSSSEFSATNALYVIFFNSDGTVGNFSKGGGLIRPIRAF
jgi:hypothetical protein